MAVDIAREGGTAIVTVNRPEAMNALDVEHAETLRDTLAELAADESARVVVLTGAGEKAFIAGADIKYMQGLGVLEARRWGELGHACGNLLETMPKPTIAAINGYALGGGCELALACDLRLASSNARIGQPEIDLGILPGWGGSVRLARTTTLGFAKSMILTGRPVDAAEALQHGLVNAVYEPEELREQTLDLCRGLEAKSPVALAYAKEAVNLALQGPHRTNLESEARLFAMLFASEDQKEGMAAFTEKRPPEFTGR
ncbi:MAG: enoyl-CoA hydratase-related protein [Gaiellaceae bacterium]